MRSKLRAFLTVGGIAIGVISVVVISSVGEIGKSAINSQMTNMGMDSFVVTGDTDNYSGLWEEDLSSLKNVSEVRNAMPLINYYTETQLLDKSNLAMVWGVNEDADDVIELKVLHGRLLDRGDILGNAKTCVIDEQLAVNTYGYSDIVGKCIDISVNGAYEKYEIVGVVSNGVNLLQNMFGDLVPVFVYVPYTTLSNEISQVYFNQIAVKLNDESNSECVEKTLEHAIACGREMKTEVEIENLLKQKSQLNGIADNLDITIPLWYSLITD